MICTPHKKLLDSSIHVGFLWKERPLERPKRRWQNIEINLK